MTAYRIVRFHQEGNYKSTITSGLTLDEAQEHCNNPETSSTTATSVDARAYTEEHGAWFDGYEKEAT